MMVQYVFSHELCFLGVIFVVSISYRLTRAIDGLLVALCNMNMISYSHFIFQRRVFLPIHHLYLLSVKVPREVRANPS